jgi:hypothetical protein
LVNLRQSLKKAQDDLAEAEKQLKEEQAEITKLERRLQLRLGRQLEQLSKLDEELDEYRDKIQRYRSPDPDALDAGYLPVEEQYRRVWHSADGEDPAKESDPGSSMDEKQFKRLYRRLARRYHPDLARDQDEREIRNVQMAALNEAYEAGSLIELAALAGNAKDPTGAGEVAGTDQQMIKILKKELATVRRRTLLIQNELENLHNLPTVQLSLQVKIARRSGRDLLAEMARDLKRQIARKTAERDLLKDQFEELSR